jgi:hypothetical protein
VRYGEPTPKWVSLLSSCPLPMTSVVNAFAAHHR